MTVMEWERPASCSRLVTESFLGRVIIIIFFFIIISSPQKLRRADNSFQRKTVDRARTAAFGARGRQS